MEKIYGYKENETKKLIEFIKDKRDIPLSKVFSEFASITGKSKGTIRNMYYAIVKKSHQDTAFCEKHFDGVPLPVQKIVEFSKEQEKDLIKKIIIGVNQNRSVRSVITSLAGGNPTLALRYQNKYRNLLTHSPEYIKSILVELKEQTGKDYKPVQKRKKAPISKFQLKKLQSEIDALLERVSEKYKKENGCLLTRVAELEMENSRLKNMLFGGTSKGFFSLEKDETIC